MLDAAQFCQNTIHSGGHSGPRTTDISLFELCMDLGNEVSRRILADRSFATPLRDAEEVDIVLSPMTFGAIAREVDGTNSRLWVAEAIGATRVGQYVQARDFPDDSIGLRMLAARAGPILGSISRQEALAKPANKAYLARLFFRMAIERLETVVGLGSKPPLWVKPTDLAQGRDELGNVIHEIHALESKHPETSEMWRWMREVDETAQRQLLKLK